MYTVHSTLSYSNMLLNLFVPFAPAPAAAEPCFPWQHSNHEPCHVPIEHDKSGRAPIYNASAAAGEPPRHSCAECCGFRVEAVPPSSHLPTFYQKQVRIPTPGIAFIAASSNVTSDAALLEAALTAAIMAEKRPIMLEQLAARAFGRCGAEGPVQVHLGVMASSEVTTDIPEHSDLNQMWPETDWNAYRGLGATYTRPVVTCAEENLLCYSNDVYHNWRSGARAASREGVEELCNTPGTNHNVCPGENICVHEFAHALHEGAMEPYAHDVEVDIVQSFHAAKAAHALSVTDTYAGSNQNEYTAEGVQTLMHVNRGVPVTDGIASRIDTRPEQAKDDPRLQGILRSQLPDAIPGFKCPPLAPCDCATFRCPATSPARAYPAAGVASWLSALPFGVPPPAATPEPPAVPGLGDVCAHFPASQPRCSPEICNVAAGARVQLEARTYYQDRAVVLPAGSTVVGAGINKTFVVNCGEPSSEMRGFVLGNDTYVGHFTFQGHSPSRGGFSGAVQTPGGASAGVANVLVEHIHIRPFDNGSHWWPLVNDAAWFPPTARWTTASGERATGSRNITLRGVISWGTWADGINFHGGHHDVLVEDCEMSYTGDDPFGLWPDSKLATEDRDNCQRNIVLRRNVGRWPRQTGGSAGKKNPRDNPNCTAATNAHNCFAQYGGGSGVMWLNNHCEGAEGVVRFLGAFPWNELNYTIYCGPVAVAGNTYSAMPGQGYGCRTENSTAGWCEKSNFSGGQPSPFPPPTIGGQCNTSEPLLPPRCEGGRAGDKFAACAQTSGVGGVCFNDNEPAVRCVSATALAEGAVDMCKGFSRVCTLY